MKLTFKDLKQQKFQIEAEPSEKIGAVKEKISKEKGWEPSTQKLIYSGKILQDDNTIESYKIEEKGFIVCMTSKVSGNHLRSAESITDSPHSPRHPRSLQSHLRPLSQHRRQLHLLRPLRPPPTRRQHNRRLLRLQLQLQLRATHNHSMTRQHLPSASSALPQSLEWRAWASREMRLTGRCAPPSSTRIVRWNIC